MDKQCNVFSKEKIYIAPHQIDYFIVLYLRLSYQNQLASEQFFKLF